MLIPFVNEYFILSYYGRNFVNESITRNFNIEVC